MHVSTRSGSRAREVLGEKRNLCVNEGTADLVSSRTFPGKPVSTTERHCQINVNAFNVLHCVHSSLLRILPAICEAESYNR